MPSSPSYRPAPRFASLGGDFFDVVTAAAFPSRRLRFRNQRWAEKVGLGALDDAEWESHFARFEPLPGNLQQPLALRYHGHQFNSYNPNLGDGRGFLYAQLADDAGRLLDLGTKGSGTTPWSRGGDGRLTLKGGVREVLATEMLEALGVYTSKSFSLFETGEALQRGDEPSPTRSSVLVRLSHSHVRFGSFQRHLHHSAPERVKRLLDYSVESFFPELASEQDVAVAFLQEVTRRSAVLCASWLAAGFVHGVLNSDNMVVTGESFDYGPWRFLPTYDPGFTAAYFDETGLYCFGRQPRAVLTNLTRLASCLEGLSPKADRERALGDFVAILERERTARLLARLGLAPLGDDQDLALCTALLDFLATTQIAYDRIFFDWWGGAASRDRAAASPCAPAYATPEFEPLRARLFQHAPVDAARLSHPYFQRARPCSMTIEEVERLWTAIAEHDDWTAFEQKLADVRELGDAHGLVPAARGTCE